MAIFKTKAIILKISKVKDKDFIYDIFTFDYGRIKAQKKEHKKEKSLDLGYIINCEIETKEQRDIHKIKNIKIKKEFNCENKDFATINEYLTIIGLVYNKLPEGIVFKDVFEIIEEINDTNNIDEIKLILSRLKVINLLGELNLMHEDELVQKVLKFINSNKLKEIFKLNGFDEVIKEKLRRIN
ncbi:MAG: recombination protein O N-terminal domain-containing protein [Candidatus Gracilibacteria bacterium]